MELIYKFQVKIIYFKSDYDTKTKDIENKIAKITGYIFIWKSKDFEGTTFC